MKTFQRNAFGVLAASGLFLASAQGALAQQPPSPHVPETPREQSQPMTEHQRAETEQVRGELLRVDADEKTLTVRETNGTEREFSYDDSTTIVGAAEGTAGLATMSGATVTVHYDTDDDDSAVRDDSEKRKATKIEITPRS